MNAAKIEKLEDKIQGMKILPKEKGKDKANEIEEEKPVKKHAQEVKEKQISVCLMFILRKKYNEKVILLSSTAYLTNFNVLYT